ncbi:hypothetical protein CPB83DRAFT_862630 [Crepidotus variabilis]|uniref:Pentatricopeptide repeat-containing protein n=1 Tax=Crepidotus variabilis TaxID=179855 RepID=A0A9P6E6N2_9AGAR|nr:hypothetical protein CPB83DRAFT_862630 [Crepidotus variabilis]
MLRPVVRPTTLNLLEQLTPSLVSRARSFSQPAENLKRNGTPTSSITTRGPRKAKGPLVDPDLREQILAASQSRRFLPSASLTKFNTALAQITEATKAHDLLGALKLWQALEDHLRTLKNSDVRRLPDSHVRDLHKIFVSNGLTALRTRDGKALEKTARDFALQAAKHHSAEAVSVLMVLYIQVENPNAALDFYNECIQVLGPLQPPASLIEESKDANANSSLPKGSDFGLALPEEVVSPDHFDPGRVSAVLAGVAAHAMLDNFKSAFDLYHSAGISASSFRRQHFLQYFSQNPKMEKKVRLYIDRVIVASIVARPISFSKHIANLADLQTIHKLQSFYNHVLDGIFGPEPYLAASPSLLSSSPNLLAALDESCWTALQTGFIKCDRVELAAKVWDDLARAQIKPGVAMWTGLLDSHARRRNSAQAVQTWEMMLGEGIQPDHLSYRALIQALMDDGQMEAGLKMFKEYQQTIGGRELEELGRPVYNTMIHGFLRRNQIEYAAHLLEDMRKHGPKPDLITYNTFFGYYGRQKDFKALSGVLNQMSESNITGDVVTFSTILSALLTVGRKDAPSTVMNLMRKHGIQPNVATYTAIIDAQMRECGEPNLNAALALLVKMEKEDGIKPNEVTYTAILAGLYRGEWISRQKADLVRSKLVQRMRAERVSFSLTTYHILMRAALDSADEQGHIDALDLLREMEDAHVPRVTSTWFILLAGLMRRDKWDAAHEVVGKMINSGHLPSRSLQLMMKDVFANYRAGRVVQQMH